MATRNMYKYGASIWYDDAHLARWLDAIGDNVTKIIYDFGNPKIASADTLVGWTTTLVEAGAGESTVAGSASIVGGSLLLTSDANEDDGVQLQVSGEAFKLTGSNPCYFGVEIQTNDATQTDILVGLCITDTTLLGGMTDGVYFECLDGSTDINFVLEKDSTETTSASAVGTLVDNTAIMLEFYYDGTNIDCFVDGVLKTRLVNTNLPDDELLTPSIAFLTGEAVANTLNVNKLRVIQINS